MNEHGRKITEEFNATVEEATIRMMKRLSEEDPEHYREIIEKRNETIEKRRAYQRKRYHEHPELQREYNKRWYKKRLEADAKKEREQHEQV